MVAAQIDYVRVYQNPQDSAQIVGCSTPSHPTSTYIKGWADKYKADGDLEPLRAVATGGQGCASDGECGHGTCVKQRCRCVAGRTGPSCLAAVGFDDDQWEPEAPLRLAGTLVNPIYMYFRGPSLDSSVNVGPWAPPSGH